MRLSPHASTRLVVIASVMLAGCATDAVYAPPPVNDPLNLFWSLTLDHHAVTLNIGAPYDTITLTATPRTVKGQAMTGLPAPTFTSLDLDHVQISSSGVVHAIASGSQCPIVASLSIGNDTHADTVLINVTDTTSPPVLATFTIHPAPGDSAKTDVVDGATVTARAYDRAGDSIVGLSVYFTVSDSTTATIDRSLGLINPVRPGHVIVYATATAYGITKADTLPYTIGYALFVASSITAQLDSTGKAVNVFVPSRFTIGPGGNVGFFNSTQVATDVTFDDSTLVAAGDIFCAFPAWCTGGNIAPFVMTSANDYADDARIRSFAKPGTYHFHSKVSGAAGTVTVMTY